MEVGKRMETDLDEDLEEVLAILRHGPSYRQTGGKPLSSSSHGQAVTSSESSHELSWTGNVHVEKVRGKSVATRFFAKYPLKLMLPSKACDPEADVVWVYSMSYGGGVVSGDKMSLRVHLAPHTTAVLTTQASTKVYRRSSAGSSPSSFHALLEVQEGALACVLPEGPVQCFAGSSFEQWQHVLLHSSASVVLLDWASSGRRERGELPWTMRSFCTTNSLAAAAIPTCQAPTPLLLDKIELGEGHGRVAGVELLSVAQRMACLHVMATIIIAGPRTVALQQSMEASVHQRAQRAQGRGAKGTGAAGRFHGRQGQEDTLVVSCSRFGGGKQEGGLLVRIGASATEAVYRFLRDELASLRGDLGVFPFASLG